MKRRLELKKAKLHSLLAQSLTSGGGEGGGSLEVLHLGADKDVVRPKVEREDPHYLRPRG